MKKLLIIIYMMPSIVIMVMVLYFLAGFQLDSARIYNNLLRNVGVKDHVVFKMLFVAYIFIISGLHIFVSFFLLILKYINKRIFYVGLAMLCFMPIRIVLVFGLNFAYLPFVIFEFKALKFVIFYVTENKKLHS